MSTAIKGTAPRTKSQRNARPKHRDATPPPPNPAAAPWDPIDDLTRDELVQMFRHVNARAQRLALDEREAKTVSAEHWRLERMTAPLAWTELEYLDDLTGEALKWIAEVARADGEDMSTEALAALATVAARIGSIIDVVEGCRAVIRKAQDTDPIIVGVREERARVATEKAMRVKLYGPDPSFDGDKAVAS